METTPQNCAAFELVLENEMALGCIFVPRNGCVVDPDCVWQSKMGSLEHDDGLGGGHGLGGVPFCFVWQSLKMDLAWLLLQYDNIILIRFFVLLFRWISTK